MEPEVGPEGSRHPDQRRDRWSPRTRVRQRLQRSPVGSLPPATGKTMRFTGTSILKVENGLITEEIGLDDGVTVLQQLGLITAA